MESKYRNILIKELTTDGISKESKFFVDHKEAERFLGRRVQYVSVKIRKKQYVLSSKLSPRYFVVVHFNYNDVDYKEQVINFYSMHEWPDGKIHSSGITRRMSRQRMIQRQYQHESVKHLLRKIQLKYGDSLVNAEGTEEFKLLQELLSEKRG